MAHDTGPARFLSHARDALIAVFYSRARVDHDHADVAPLEGGLRAHHHVVFDGALDFSAAANARRVQQDQFLAVPFEVRIDRVARRPRNRANDHALFAENRIHQRRFADIRAADDGEADGILVHLLGVEIGREQLDDLVEQVGNAVPVRCRNRMDFA